MKRACTILLALSIILSLGAQVPKSFKYQGVARYQDGTLVGNKTIAIEVNLLQDPGGSPSVVYTEVHHPQTNELGIFGLNIGEGATAGNFSSIDWTSGAFSLSIGLDVSNGSTFSSLGVSPLLSVPYALYAENSGNGTSQWNQNGTSIYFNEGNVGIGSTDPAGKLEVKGSELDQAGKPLFEVKDKLGATVFAVYEDSVRIYVTDGAKGGRGGFAVGSRSTTKGISGDIMLVTPDSIRMYIDDSPLLKGGRGGFAVGGRTGTKAPARSYFDISGKASAEIINPSQPRILWYPRKEAFLTGRILVEHPDSVGTNSLSAGFESKAVGNYSQAMGYKCIARGDNSTAFGDSSLANGKSSFAAGVNAKALFPGTFALGKDVIAKGIGSFSIGLNTLASGMNSVAFGTATTASGSFAIAMGSSTEASSIGGIALGNNARSSGFNAIALGLSSVSSGDLSASLGNQAKSSGLNSTALGYASKAIGKFSAVLGSEAIAAGEYSLALGPGSIAAAPSSTAIGYEALAENDGGVAIGLRSIASFTNAIALGTQARAEGLNSLALGQKSIATAEGATSVGGGGAEASGPFSMAFGWKASTNAMEGAVVFGDHSSNTTLQADAPNQFVARMDGGYKLYTNNNLSNGVTLNPGSGSWSVSSDRNKKENFLFVDREEILHKLASVEIGSWNYIAQGNQIRHIGITSQDFLKTFGFGESETTISEVDLAGVSMVAIQALNDRTNTLEQELQELKKQNELLQQQIMLLKQSMPSGK